MNKYSHVVRKKSRWKRYMENIVVLKVVDNQNFEWVRKLVTWRVQYAQKYLFELNADLVVRAVKFNAKFLWIPYQFFKLIVNWLKPWNNEIGYINTCILIIWWSIKTRAGYRPENVSNCLWHITRFAWLLVLRSSSNWFIVLSVTLCWYIVKSPNYKKYLSIYKF